MSLTGNISSNINKLLKDYNEKGKEELVAQEYNSGQDEENYKSRVPENQLIVKTPNQSVAFGHKSDWMLNRNSKYSQVFPVFSADRQWSLFEGSHKIETCNCG